MKKISEETKYKFVRSQDHLAIWSDNAKGRVFLFDEAVKLFGQEMVSRVIRDRVIPLVDNSESISSKIRQRREELGISFKQLSKHTGLDVEVLEVAEDPNHVSKIRDLEKIYISLNLNENYIGLLNNESVENISIRFKELAGKYFGRISISQLVMGESLWATRKSASFLSEVEREAAKELRRWALVTSKNICESHDLYYRQGIELARAFRIFAGISNTVQVESVCDIWDDVIKIHIINVDIGKSVSALTMYTDDFSGCIINSNNSITSRARRFAAAHEICHYLFDSKDIHFKYNIDDLNMEVKMLQDVVSPEEKRANAFAVEFLCPKDAIIKLFKNLNSQESFAKLPYLDRLALLVDEIVENYGLSASSAIYHIINNLSLEKTLYRDIRDRWNSVKKTNDCKDWNLAELSYRNNLYNFMQPVRVGLLVKQAVEHFKSGIISEDTLISTLGISQSEVVSVCSSVSHTTASNI